MDDPVWLSQYHSLVPGDPNPARYRSWGTLRYILRGIEKFIPWVRNVYIILSGPSQLPPYIDPSRVHIIYHKDIIPGRFLPCFSSNPIETYMWMIPGLSEYFVYFNDDMVPISVCRKVDLFGGSEKIVARCSHVFSQPPTTPNIFHQIKQNCSELAACAAGISIDFQGKLLGQRHGPTPLLRSACTECFRAIQSQIESITTPFRHPSNVCQYLYSDYMLFRGLTDCGEVPQSLTYIDFRKDSIEKATQFITGPATQFICINDSKEGVSETQFPLYKSAICDAFEKLLPGRSHYEL